MENFFILSAILLLSNTVEAISGFGSTIITVTLGSNFYNIAFILPVIVPLNIFLSLYIVLRYKVHIETELLIKKILPFMGLGLIGGLIIFNILKSDTLKKIYGLLVILLSIRELYNLLKKAKAEKKPMPTWKSSIWMVLSGIIHGIYASGGPLLVYSISSLQLSKQSFRVNLSVVWLILNLVLLTMYFQTGKITSETVKYSGMLLPVLPVGILFGELLHHRINERIFRIGVFSLLVIAGFSLILAK